MTDITLDDYFGGSAPSEELERIPLVPWGNYTSTELDISPYKWTDFEDMIVTSRHATLVLTYAPEVITKEVITPNPTSWEATCGYTDPQDNYTMTIRATGESTATIQYSRVGVINIGSIVGLKKRYATKNSSKTIVLSESNTTGGTFVAGEVQVSQAYDIDIASVLGTEYVGKKLILSMEYYNNSGVGEAEWFKGDTQSGFFDGSLNGFRHGQSSITHTDTRIRVATSGYTARTNTNDIARLNWNDLPSPVGAGNITSTLCRVTVMTNEQYVTNNTLALINALEARIEALENA